ncbi:hypothetical protein [Streptomyces sp. SID14515]|uniref:hypothetical protein n=1 Tax=Streptomyces sp. SID14515 TaxID=2706074 RepID=UPI001EF2DD15|nr:hypothetical protein [Streptomyces sp. SID14515]
MTVPATGRGRTTVAPRAVRRIAERAAAEALPVGGAVTRGSASVRGASARVAVGVRLPYPVRTDEAAERIRDHAQTRTASLTGLSVREADIRIDALSVLPVPPARQPADGEPPGPTIRLARRSIPCGALAGVAGSGRSAGSPRR